MNLNLGGCLKNDRFVNFCAGPDSDIFNEPAFPFC